MAHVERAFSRSLVVGTIVMLCSGTSVVAAEPYEGVWANSRKHCGDSDAPNSKTFIDLNNVFDEKPSPLFDQYENHCLIRLPASMSGDVTILTGICFAFWEDFTKGVNGTTSNIKLIVTSKDILKINGTSYRRCAAKGRR